MKNDEAEKGKNRDEKGSSSPAKIMKAQKFVKCLENGDRVAGNGDGMVNPGHNLKGLDSGGNEFRIF